LNPHNLPQLQLGDAVAAILVTADGRYLLQLRDDTTGIWYPGHWGMFGGAIDPGEDEIGALRRELREEIELDLDAGQAKPFTRFDFDLRPAGLGSYFRSYYEICLTRWQLERLVLREGAEMRSFSGDEALTLQLSPYDSFALFLHHQRRRLTTFPRL
jgi:8-oxo-dGTP pyrophosphatase MutT (NUDIX family)